MNTNEEITRYLLDKMSSYVFNTDESGNIYNFVNMVITPEIHWTKVFLENLHTQLFVDSAEGFFLDLQGKRRGVIRTTETDDIYRGLIQSNSGKIKSRGDVNTIIKKISILTNVKKEKIKVMTTETNKNVPVGEMYIEITTDLNKDIRGTIEKIIDAGTTLVRIDMISEDTFMFTDDINLGSTRGFNHGKFGDSTSVALQTPPKVVASPVTEILGATEHDVLGLFGDLGGDNSKVVITDTTTGASQFDINNIFGDVTGDTTDKATLLRNKATNSEVEELFLEVMASTESDINKLFGISSGDSTEVVVTRTDGATERMVNQIFGDNTGENSKIIVDIEKKASDDEIEKMFTIVVKNGGV